MTEENKNDSKVESDLKIKLKEEVLSMALSHRPVDRIMRKAGAERVSEAAARELARILEDKAIEISKLAIKYAQHAGRKTVKAEDIKLALR